MAVKSSSLSFSILNHNCISGKWAALTVSSGSLTLSLARLNHHHLHHSLRRQISSHTRRTTFEVTLRIIASSLPSRSSNFISVGVHLGQTVQKTLVFVCLVSSSLSWSYSQLFSYDKKKTKHLSSNNILCNVQHGFRQRFSCETQLISAIHDWAKSINIHSQTDVVLLDFSKAFDSVPHQRLLMKLNYYSIWGNMLLCGLRPFCRTLPNQSQWMASNPPPSQCSRGFHKARFWALSYFRYT